MPQVTENSHNVPARSLIGLMIASVGLTLLGVMGVAAIVMKLYPTPEVRLLFLLPFFAAVTGMAVPFVWFLGRRFGRPDAPMATSTLILTSLIIGLVATALVWLRISG